MLSAPGCQHILHSLSQFAFAAVLLGCLVGILHVAKKRRLQLWRGISLVADEILFNFSQCCWICASMSV